MLTKSARRAVAGATAGVVGVVGAASSAAAHGTAVAGTGDQYVLENSHAPTGADVVYTYGGPNDLVLVGDWNGDGADTFAVRRGSTFHLTDTHTDAEADVTFSYGRPDDVVLVGDWDGDGIDTFGVRRGNTVYLKNNHAGGAADVSYAYGRPGDEVLVGNWDGDASGDSLGIRRGNTFHLKNAHAGGGADTSYSYGRADDAALAGDWDGDGTDTVAIRRVNRYHLKNTHAGGGSDLTYSFGGVGEAGFAGDWDGNGTDTLGLRRAEPQEPVDPLSTSMVDLGTLGGQSTVPAAVNDHGQVVGQSQTADGTWHAFIWERGVMTSLDAVLPGARARDINNRGEVVLSRPFGDGPEESALWSPDGVTRLGAVEAIKVNEQGQVAGNISHVDESGIPHRNPFLWTAGTRVDMDPIPGWAESTSFVDLNDDGVVLGQGLGPDSLQLSFTWADGELTVLETVASSIQNVAADLNDRGQVTGYDHVPGREPTNGAYVWEPGGFRYIMRFDMTQHLEPEALSDRGQVTGAGHAGAEPPGPTDASRALFWDGTRLSEIGPESESSIGLDVNDHAQVVGWARRPSGDEATLSRAFAWQAGRHVLLPVPANTARSEAIAVSEASHVLGSVTDSSGAQRAVLWVLGGGTGRS